jgi:UDP-N-acetylmuramate dehydrogenase
MEFREQVSLAPYTTFGIGGPARWFVDVATEGDLLAALKIPPKGTPLLALGGGSNLLVADEGFPGLVLHLALAGIEELECGDPEYREFSVAAGESWDDFVSFTVERGCGGLECLAGIPGTAGGTPIQNVGAYGQEVSTTVASVRALDLTRMEYVDLPAAACGFAYRQSIFNTTDRGRYIVTRVDFRLASQAPPMTHYKDVMQYFKDQLEPPSLTEVAAGVRKIRRSKGMLLLPGDPDCRSAGSFFKNPVLSVEELRAVADGVGVPPEAVPQFNASGGLIKIPAAWLLEQAGFHKGYQLGRAGISSRHTLALVNLGGATAGEILALRDAITAGVLAKFGVRLEMEPVIVGG